MKMQQVSNNCFAVICEKNRYVTRTTASSIWAEGL